MAADLTDSELLAFCGLVRYLVRLDGQSSEQERVAIAQVGPNLAAVTGLVNSPYREAPEGTDKGDERFWSMMDRAVVTLPDDASIRATALCVERPEARQEIYAALHEVAATDTINAPERSLLEWLSSEWGVGPGSFGRV